MKNIISTDKAPAAIGQSTCKGRFLCSGIEAQVKLHAWLMAEVFKFRISSPL